MTDDATVVRWRRAGRRRFTRWHLPASIAADRRGRTQCGLYFARNQSETGALADGELCRNCLKAVANMPESIAA